jgi:hypothetical protein
MHRWFLALATLALGCDVKEGPPTIRHDAALPCRGASDCASNSCMTELGICNSPLGALDTVLFEIVPQSSDQDYGSAPFYIYQKGLARPSSEALVLNIPERVAVQGQVDAAPEQDACRRDGTSLPVALVFTPREHLLGLSVPSYSFETSLDELATNEYRFSGSLPPGRYDVYMRPRTGRALPPGCNLAPQVFRDVPVELQSAPSSAANSTLRPVQQSLRLSMRWRDELEGWNVDMVHPVTGEVISTRSTLQRSRVVDDDQGPAIDFTLHYSLGGEKDFIQGAQELVRLSPPASQADKKGVVLLQREGLELVNPGEGTIGDVTSFGDPIQYQSWVWPRGDVDSPVPGTVTFAATSLSESVGGVNASFTGSKNVDELGQVSLKLLPGDYRLRVVPLPNTGLAGSEIAVQVRSDAEMQKGQVIGVPRAVQLAGSVLTSDGDAPVPGVDVVLAASRQPLDGCSPGTVDPLCDRPRAEVLQRALGEDPFVPRSRSTLALDDGSFVIDEVDCGLCEPGQGAGFDLVVRPPAQSGLPWVLKPALRMDRDRSLDVLHIPAPVTHPLQVTFGDASTVNILPGALVTAYVLLDASSQPINDPENVPACLGARPEDPICIQSVVAIAEGRSDFKGELLLLLPPSLE